MISKHRILMVLYYYDPYVSGVSVYAKRLAEGLVEKGHEVTVIASRHEKSLPLTQTINGVRIIRKRTLFKFGKGVIMPTFLPSILKHSVQSDYVNMHLPMAETGLAAIFIPRKKLITTYQCDIYLGDSLLQKAITYISIMLMRLQLARSERIVTLSDDYFLHSKMSGYSKKSVQIYPPIPAPKHPSDAEQLFTDIGVSKNDVRIGFVGRIVYEKGIEYLLGAIPSLKERISSFKIVLLGDYSKVAGGSIKEELDNYVSKYPEHILFTGYLNDEDRDKFYAGLDVLVLPSIDPLEAFGMVQVEAMLQGTPVVASDMPGVREVIKRTGYGRLSKMKDSTDIARQIIEVVSNKKEYKPDREKVIGTFNDRGTIDAYVDLFR